MKWDGVRAISICHAGGCRIYSRNRREISSSYPELTAELAERAGGRDLVLDGEIIAQGLHGAPSFGLLQRRMHVVRPSRSLIAAVPVQLFLFDILTDSGEDVTDLPYLERRARLQALGFDAPPVQTPPHWLGIGADQLIEASRSNGLEGILSKRVDSRYVPGRRSPHWIKTPIRRNTEGLVCGYTLFGGDPMAGTFGSLVLGAYRSDGRLVHIGNVGTGFTNYARRVLRTRLDQIARSQPLFPLSPTRSRVGDVHWVEPVIVASIDYREFVGGRLRHPSFRGVRTDKAPREVRVP